MDKNDYLNSLERKQRTSGPRWLYVAASIACLGLFLFDKNRDYALLGFVAMLSTLTTIQNREELIEALKAWQKSEGSEDE